jgi:hypothetical protein
MPPAHLVPSEHVPPPPTQIDTATSQQSPGAEQLAPAQHGPPVPPQAVHFGGGGDASVSALSVWQASVALEQDSSSVVRSTQQSSPSAPHGAQIWSSPPSGSGVEDAWQRRPALHAWSGQQGSLSLPQRSLPRLLLELPTWVTPESTGPTGLALEQ